MDGCPIIWEIRNLGVQEVESKNFGIQLESYTFMSVTRQFDGALPGPRNVFKEESFEACLVLMFFVVSQCVFL
jgi:hypothetical protein